MKSYWGVEHGDEIAKCSPTGSGSIYTHRCSNGPGAAQKKRLVPGQKALGVKAPGFPAKKNEQFSRDVYPPKSARQR